jgi:hypothetical protein
VIFDVDVAAHVIRDGPLMALKAGDGAVTCTLVMEMPGGDIEHVKQQRKIDLHLIINIGHGIPLLPADAHYEPGLRRARRRQQPHSADPQDNARPARARA